MSRTMAIAIVLFAAAARVHAADFCVSNETELRNALAAAQLTAAADHVRLQAGSITLTQSLFFSSQGSPTGALTLSGGWDAGCANRQLGAQWTKIDAGDPQVAVGLSPDDDLTLTDLHFADIPQGVNLSNPVAGPQVTTLRVSRVAVFNDQFVGDALTLFSPADRIEIDNLLVDAMASCAVAAATFEDAGELTIRSSTLIARRNPDFAGPAGAAICFDGAENADLNAAIDSVFNSSEGIDVHVNGRPVVMQSSAYSDIQGCEPCGVPEPLDAQSADNLVQPMAFDEAATGEFARFARVAQSTVSIPGLIDSGAPQSLLLYPADVMGRPRLSGTAIDRGAFEAPDDAAVFGDGFEGF